MTVIERKPNKPQPPQYYEEEENKRWRRQREKEDELARVRDELANLIQQRVQSKLSEYAKEAFEQQIADRIKKLETSDVIQKPSTKERLEIELKSFKDLVKNPDLSEDLRKILDLEIANREHQLKISEEEKEPVQEEKLAA